MEWLFVLPILAILIYMGWSANREEQRQKDEFQAALQSKTQHFQSLLLQGELPELNHYEYDYRPVSGETLHAVVKGVKDHRNGNAGRLLITSKAIVFETAARSDRFPLTSVTQIQLSLDGFTIRKRSGPVRPFFTGPDAELLALINVISWRLE